MTILKLEANRNTYGAMDAVKRGTMTVGELIDFLSGFEEDSPVIISNDNGYTYGNIRYEDFRDEDTEDEE